MPQDLYHYEKMIDRALRGVVREALERASREGLRGAHHFYVGFATDMPGVSIPDSLRARYPQLAAMRIEGLPVVAVRIDHVASWGSLDVA